MFITKFHVQAIIAHGAVIKHDVVINDCCLIGQNVQLGPNLNVPTLSSFSSRNPQVSLFLS